MTSRNLLYYVPTKEVTRLRYVWAHLAASAAEINATAPVCDVVRKLSEELSAANVDDGTEAQEPTLAATTWRERLWTCPLETRLNVSDLAEAVGRPKSWVYRQTAVGRLPSRKLDGALVFVAHEVREWLNRQEEPVARRA